MKMQASRIKIYFMINCAKIPFIKDMPLNKIDVRAFDWGRVDVGGLRLTEKRTTSPTTFLNSVINNHDVIVLRSLPSEGNNLKLFQEMVCSFTFTCYFIYLNVLRYVKRARFDGEENTYFITSCITLGSFKKNGRGNCKRNARGGRHVACSKARRGR